MATAAVPLFLTKSNAWATLQRELTEASWVVLLGTAEEPILDALRGSEIPVLVVEADATLLEKHAKYGDGLGIKKLVFMEQIVGSNADEKPWFHYNDCRQDGELPLSVLKSTFPNLRLESMEIRQQVSLSDLLEAWAPAQADGGVLVLPSNAGLEWLEAAIPHLQRLRLLARRCLPSEVCSSFTAIKILLRKAWLLPQQLEDSRSSGLELWVRDASLHFEATVLVERDGLRCQVQILQDEKLNLIAERDERVAERDDLRENVQRLELRLSEVNRELDEILTLMDTAVFADMRNAGT